MRYLHIYDCFIILVCTVSVSTDLPFRLPPAHFLEHNCNAAIAMSHLFDTFLSYNL